VRRGAANAADGARGLTAWFLRRGGAKRRIPSPLLLLAAALLLVAGCAAHVTPPFDRAAWPHWVDDDGDCQDARQEVLIRQGQNLVFDDPGRPCRVVAGTWVDPYTGTEITDPAALDVDHVVPLAEAHRSGGARWSREQKRAYANFLGYAFHLMAVSASENRRKSGNRRESDRGPDRYLPPNPAILCQYAEAWSAIKTVWGLTTTASERDALRAALAACPSPP
jgi:hypothetical protein